MANAFLDADQIRAASFVRYIEVHETLGSTNDRAAELAPDSNIELPALVVTRQQSAGRGRGTNVWLSTDGALTFSVLLEPASLGIYNSDWPRLSLATGVAVCDALKDELGVDKERAGSSSSADGGEDAPARCDNLSRLAIKWPNDVMLNDRKVCGILIESPGGPAPAKDRLIIGIGINVNNLMPTTPSAAGISSTAMRDSTSKMHDLNSVLIRTLQGIQRRIDQLSKSDPELADAWQRQCWLTERRVEIQTGRDCIDGICAGIDVDGTLIVDNVYGTHRVHSGSVRVL